MRATLLYQAGDVRVEDVEDPKVKQPTDAVVRIVAGSVCGSDLWPYKSQPFTDHPRHMGHEFPYADGTLVKLPVAETQGCCLTC